MKKLTAVVFVALALACLAPLSGATVIGLKGGLNLANMTIKAEDPADLPDFKSQPGLVAGVFVSFDLGPVAIRSLTRPRATPSRLTTSRPIRSTQ